MHTCRHEATGSAYALGVAPAHLVSDDTAQGVRTEILVCLEELGKTDAPAGADAMIHGTDILRTGIGTTVVIVLACPVVRAETAGAGKAQPIGNVPGELQVSHDILAGTGAAVVHEAVEGVVLLLAIPHGAGCCRSTDGQGIAILVERIIPRQTLICHCGILPVGRIVALCAVVCDTRIEHNLLADGGAEVQAGRIAIETGAD